MDNATNNRMELLAIEQGLLAIRKPRQWVTVYTDSLGAINWLTGRWKIKDRQSRAWPATSRRWLRKCPSTWPTGTSTATGVALNERANKLAQTQAAGARVMWLPGPFAHTPGFVVQRWAENQGVHVP